MSSQRTAAHHGGFLGMVEYQPAHGKCLMNSLFTFPVCAALAFPIKLSFSQPLTFLTLILILSLMLGDWNGGEGSEWQHAA